MQKTQPGRKIPPLTMKDVARHIGVAPICHHDPAILRTWQNRQAIEPDGSGTLSAKRLDRRDRAR